MPTFYVTTDPDKRGRKFQAKDVEAARLKVQRLSDQTGREHFLYYPKKRGLFSWLRWNPHTDTTHEVDAPKIATVKEILEAAYTPTATRAQLAEAVGEALELLEEMEEETEPRSRSQRR